MRCSSGSTWRAELTASYSRRYAGDVQRVSIERIRICPRCGRGRAELRGEDGATLVVPLDATRSRQLAATTDDDLRSLTDLMLEQLEAGGRQPGEVVLEVADGRLR